MPVGQVCTGAMAVEEYDLVMLFFHGFTLSVRVVGGRLVWESSQEQVH